MEKMKIKEALKIINDRETKKRLAASSEKQKLYQWERNEERKKAAAQREAEKNHRPDYNKVRNMSVLPPELKAELIEKTCPCGRKFRVLTLHKGVKRRRCRICKPY